MIELSKESLLAALPGLVEIARKHAEVGERERNLARPVVDAFVGAGVFRMCRPRVFGGLELDPLTSLRVLEELARGDGAAGWCAMVSGAGSMFEGFAPLEGAAEIYSNPDVVIGGVGFRRGRAIAVEGGYRVSGRWPMASNCKQCQWLLAGCLLFDGDVPRTGPEGMPAGVIPIVAASDCRILDTWDVSGLRGTGSHDFEVSDVFVPERRCIGVPIGGSPHPGPLFAFPPMGFQAVTVAATALGIARAAIDEFCDLAKSKTPFGSRTGLAASPTGLLAFTEAESLWRSARAWMFEASAKVWDHVSARREVPVEDRGMLRLASTHATRAAARAVDVVYGAGGASSIYARSPLQRHFRDIHAVTQHGSVAAPTYELIGTILLGVNPDARSL